MVACLAWNVANKSQARYLETLLIQFLKDQGADSFSYSSSGEGGGADREAVKIFLESDHDDRHNLFSSRR